MSTVLKHKPKPNFRLEEIGPTKAAEYIKANVNNRVISMSHVHELALQMEKGLWMPTDQGIGFDWNGNLSNGQHRLLAVIESGATIQIMVARNLDPEAKKVIDRSMNARSASDVFYMRGYGPNNKCKTLATAINLMHRFSIDGHFRNHRNKLYQDQFDTYYERYPQLMRWVDWAHRTNPPRGLAKGTLAGIGTVFQLAEAEAGLEADVFMEQVVSGTGLEEGAPILRLRDRLMKSAYDKESKLSGHAICWLIIKVWNATAEGRSIKILKIRSDETPPIVVGFDATRLPFYGENEDIRRKRQ